MLTADQIELLRARCIAANARAPSGRWCTCVDGPLADIAIRVPEWGCRTPGASWAFSFLTDRGPVVAMYVQAREPNCWRFRGYECPGARESGHSAA
jgi:hypothetical protein